jgi:hypothetical protein
MNQSVALIRTVTSIDDIVRSTVLSSIFFAPVSCGFKASWAARFAIDWLIENSTSSAVSFAPFENVRSSRRVKRQALLSASSSHLVATDGIMLKSLSNWTSESNCAQKRGTFTVDDSGLMVAGMALIPTRRA